MPLDKVTATVSDAELKQALNLLYAPQGYQVESVSVHVTKGDRPFDSDSTTINVSLKRLVTG